MGLIHIEQRHGDFNDFDRSATGYALAYGTIDFPQVNQGKHLYRVNYSNRRVLVVVSFLCQSPQDNDVNGVITQYYEQARTVDQGRYEDELLRSLWRGLATTALCHGYRVTSVTLERDGATSMVRLRLGLDDRLGVISLVRVVWHERQDYPPDLLAATFTTAVEEWTCARDTPRESDIDLGEINI